VRGAALHAGRDVPHFVDRGLEHLRGPGVPAWLPESCVTPVSQNLLALRGKGSEWWL
jgi:hypothetical protein